MNRFTRRCAGLCKMLGMFAVVGFLTAAVGVFCFVQWFYYAADDEIRQCVETTLSEHYSSLEASVASASLVEGEGVVVRGLTLSRPRTQ
ncbi:MAG: hypothetical protein N2C14_17055, partial [Planctomycetales bacterium]